MDVGRVGAGVPAQTTPDQKLQQACQDFEALFLKSLLGEMRRAGGNAMAGGSSGQVYQEMFDEALARELAQRPGIGLGEMLKENVLKIAKSTAEE